MPSVFALGFQNGLQYRYLHKAINTGDDAVTLCKNLVNLGVVTAKITFLICVPYMVVGQKLSYDLHSSRWHFQMH